MGSLGTGGAAGANKGKDARKQDRFRRTVLAVDQIVNQKLYKSKSSSLEQYFRDVWKISRAQVYRFIDSACVLKVCCPERSLFALAWWR